MPLRASAQSKKNKNVYRLFFIVPSLLSPFIFWIFLFLFCLWLLVFFSPVVISKPCQVCPPPPLKHWRRHKARQVGEEVLRGWVGSECLDSDGLMPSDGRCISSDASACCLSSSCVVFLFLCCFFVFSSSMRFEEMVALWRSLFYEACKRFLVCSLLFLSPNAITSSPLPRPRGGPLRSFCKVNMTEVAESLHELSRCFRVYTLVHVGFGTAA